MRLWIVGAKGLLGSALHRLCQKQNILCLATAKDEADITSLESLRKVGKEFLPTHIVNCAAYADVDRSENEQELAYRINATGTENLGKVAYELGAHLVHISTDYVFDGSATRPYLESDPCAPVGAYGRSKWEGEKMLLKVFPSACILRTSWLFGRGGKNFISSMLKFMQQHEEVKVVFDQRGRPTFVNDLAECALAMSSKSGIFHFANRGEVSRFDMAKDIFQAAKELGIPTVCRKIVPVESSVFPTIAKRPAYSVLCTEKIEPLLKTPPRNWHEVLKEYLHDVKAT